MSKKRIVNRGGLAPDKYLSEDEVTKLTGYVSRREREQKKGAKRAAVNAMIIKLLLQTGMRASEICDLKVQDLPYYHGKNIIWIARGKGSVSRTIDVEQKFADEISMFIHRYRKHAKPGSHLLLSENNTKLSYQSLYSKVVRIGFNAGLRKLHPHMLRHTFLTLLYNVKKDIRYVQIIAGHASPNTTAIYAQTLDSERRQQIEALNLTRFFP